MKRLFLVVITLFITSLATSQTTFTIGDLTYETIDATSVKVFDCSTSAVSVTIPNVVNNEGVNYNVTVIGEEAFKYCYSLTNISIPESIHTIEEQAFYNCTHLIEINIPSNITSIEGNTFRNCDGLTSITIPNNVTSIEHRAFYSCDGLTSIIVPNNVTFVGEYAFGDCSNLNTITLGTNLNSMEKHIFQNSDNLTNIVCLSTTPPNIESNTFEYSPTNKNLTIPFGSDYASWVNATNWVSINHKINEGENIILNNTFEITPTNKRKLINNGVLRITQDGELFNESNESISGVFEIETEILPTGKWSFIGAPFDDYKLDAIKKGTKDVSVSLFDYVGDSAGTWSANWATTETEVGKGEGFLIWPWYQEAVVFTSKSETENYSLNDADVVVSKSLTTFREGGNWMALANPYTFKLDIDKFIEANKTDIQGQDGIYTLDDEGAFQYLTSGAINLTEGFFVNFVNPGNNSTTFTKTQRFTPTTKNQNARKEFVKLVMIDGERENELLFAHNKEAKDEYDIYDANKLFSPIEITEHYFLNGENALVKEEAATLPYYATMNIKSYENKEVSFKASNIPNGLSISIIDKENIINLNEGEIYSCEISIGENENRFKVLFDKTRSIEDMENADISISNSNRDITISSSQKDLIIEVYDTLGRKVFETKDYNFHLNATFNGIYLIKAYNKNAYSSKKILVK